MFLHEDFLLSCLLIILKLFSEEKTLIGVFSLTIYVHTFVFSLEFNPFNTGTFLNFLELACGVSIPAKLKISSLIMKLCLNKVKIVDRNFFCPQKVRKLAFLSSFWTFFQ